MKLTFKLGDFECSRLPSIMWLVLSNQLKVLKQKTVVPQGEGILPLGYLWTPVTTSPLLWVSSLLACPANFRLSRLYNHMSTFCSFLSICIRSLLVLFLYRIMAYTAGFIIGYLTRLSSMVQRNNNSVLCQTTLSISINLKYIHGTI